MLRPCEGPNNKRPTFELNQHHQGGLMIDDHLKGAPTVAINATTVPMAATALNVVFVMTLMDTSSTGVRSFVARSSPSTSAPTQVGITMKCVRVQMANA